MSDPRDQVTAVQLIASARAGSVRAIARLLSRVENGGDAAAQIAKALTGVPRRAQIVGVTGAPGAGKSTLTNALLAVLRSGEHPRSVAVLAVDPSSPFTGGALLGDRVRMSDFVTDTGVFIRSLSSRGDLGGVSAGTPAAVDLMSALGYDVVIVETVGVGQSEVDVMHLADTVVVVLAPGMGDGIQAAKAGIMEVADILVVNKADHDGARTTLREVKSMVQLAVASAPRPVAWRTPVVPAVASAGTGVGEVWDRVLAHREHVTATGEIEERRQRRAAAAVQAVVLDRVRRALSGPSGQALIAAAAAEVAAARVDHHTAAEGVLHGLGWTKRSSGTR